MFIMFIVDAGVVNCNGIKTLWANDGITLFIIGDPVIDNGRRSLSRNLPDCTILYNGNSDSFILTDKSLQKPYEYLQLVY